MQIRFSLFSMRVSKFTADTVIGDCAGAFVGIYPHGLPIRYFEPRAIDLDGIRGREKKIGCKKK